MLFWWERDGDELVPLLTRLDRGAYLMEQKLLHCPAGVRGGYHESGNRWDWRYKRLPDHLYWQGEN